MSNENQLFESELEKRIAKKYESLGFKVVVNPSKDNYPFDLGFYRPDLIAISEQKKFIIEVKSSLRNIPIDRFREIAEIVSKYDGWKFLIETGDLVTNEKTNEDFSIGIIGNELFTKLKKAELLMINKEYEIAFIYTWGILEAALRKLAIKSSIPIEKAQTLSLINHLYSQGEISFDTYNSIKVLQKTRNQVVHGFQAENIMEAAESIYAVTKSVMELQSE